MLKTPSLTPAATQSQGRTVTSDMSPINPTARWLESKLRLAVADTNKWYLWFSSEDTKKPHKDTCSSEHHSSALNTADLKSLFQEGESLPCSLCLPEFVYSDHKSRF